MRVYILYFRKLKQFNLCLGLVQKAKKAKDKLLKRDDRPDTGSYESFYYGGVDPYMWEPQELGRTEPWGKQCLVFNLTIIVSKLFTEINFDFYPSF